MIPSITGRPLTKEAGDKDLTSHNAYDIVLGRNGNDMLCIRDCAYNFIVRHFSRSASSTSTERALISG